MNSVTLLVYCYLSDSHDSSGNLLVITIDDELRDLISKRRALFLQAREQQETLIEMRYWNADGVYYATETMARQEMPTDEEELRTRMEKILDRGHEDIELYNFVDQATDGFIQLEGLIIQNEPDRMEDEQMVITTMGVWFHSMLRHSSHTSSSSEIPYAYILGEK